MKKFLALVLFLFVLSACSADAPSSTTDYVLVTHVHLNGEAAPTVSHHLVDRAEWTTHMRLARDIASGERDIGEIQQALTNNGAGQVSCPLPAMMLFDTANFGTGTWDKFSCFTGTGYANLTSGYPGCMWQAQSGGTYFCSGFWSGNIRSAWNTNGSYTCRLQNIYYTTQLTLGPNSNTSTTTTAQQNAVYLVCN